MKPSSPRGTAHARGIAAGLPPLGCSPKAAGLCWAALGQPSSEVQEEGARHLLMHLGERCNPEPPLMSACKEHCALQWILKVFHPSHMNYATFRQESSFKNNKNPLSFSMHASDYVRIPKCHEGKKNTHPDPRAVALTRDTAGTRNGRGLSRLPTLLHSAQSSKPKRLPAEQANHGSAWICSCCS